MPTSLEQVVQRLTRSGLITPSALAAFLDGLQPQQPQPQDAEQLLKLLVDTHKLTAYQAHAVLHGELKYLVFGEYKVLDKIGQGGESIVLKAEHRRMKRWVAIKVLSRRAMHSRESIRRFFREAQAAARLNHPNIVAAFDASQWEGMPYLVMEYVEGKDLGTIVKESGPLPLEQGIDCALQAARGLQYAHEQGIVHRDIKPGNLLLDKRCTVKILDMGLARLSDASMLTDQSMGERLTHTGQVMGTCDYMAPEQALDSHLVDCRADIYSLGCTLYRLLVGKGPYTGQNFMAMFLAHREARIPSLCAARPDAPPELDAVFQKMVAKRPDDRFSTMTEVMTALDACLHWVRRPVPAMAPVYTGGLESSATTVAEGSSNQFDLAGQLTPPTIEETLTEHADRDASTKNGGNGGFGPGSGGGTP